MSSADEIQDDLSDSSSVHPVHSPFRNGRKSLPVRKRRLSPETSGFFSRSQKFRKSSDRSKTVPQPIDDRTWVARYQPTGLSEVAVHKKKVSDVQEWLQRALTGRSYQSLLLLKGPSGSGKSAVLQALARVMKLEVLEWKNPNESSTSLPAHSSVASQFDDFVHTSRKFATLDLIQPSNGQATTNQAAHPVNSNVRTQQIRQLLVIEEFPNFFARSSKNLQSFRSTILQYLATQKNPSGSASKPSPMQPTPSLLVFIVSESLVSNSTSFSDSFTAHRLLGPEILNNPRVTTIEFNQVASTLITKALKLVLEKHHQATGQLYAPSDQIMQRLAEMGDVRNAISGLEFYCKQTEDLGGRLSGPSKRSRAKAKVKPTLRKPMSSIATDPGLSVITQRDSMLTLFHAVGKVLHNKRVDAVVDETSLPPHLAHNSRPHPPENEPDTLLSTAGTDIYTFLAALHENYLFSCYHPSGNPDKSLECTMNTIDALSSADVLGSISRTQNQYRAAGGGAGISEGLRQEELAFTAGVTGVMFHLPYPVKRQTSSAGNANKGLGNAHHMYYPTSQRIWREQEEVEGLVEQMLLKHYSSGLAIARRSIDNPSPDQPRPSLSPIHSSSQPSEPPADNLPNTTPSKLKAPRPSNTSRQLWTRPQPMPILHKNEPPSHLSTDTSTHDPAPLGSDLSPTRTLLLSRLPYLAHILRTPSSYPLATPSLLQTIERVTHLPTLDPASVSGKSGSTFQNPVLARRNASSLLDDDSEGESPMQEQGYHGRGSSTVELYDAVGGAVEGLVLSEDDIEDSEVEAGADDDGKHGAGQVHDDEDDEFGSDVDAFDADALDLG